MPRTDQTVGHPVVDPERRRTERPPPTSSEPPQHLHALPALTLLDRLPVPMLATRLDGIVIYTNRAFATMLGLLPDTLTLIGKRLSELLAEHSETSPPDCVTALRADRSKIVDWLHIEGFPITSVISDSIFVRADDQILLLGITDITELRWSNPTEPPAR